MARLIDKDALVAEIEERRDGLISLSESCPANTAAKSGFYAQAQTLEGVLSFINTLEVKEVDLEKEIEEQCKKVNQLAVGKELRNICRHFFELGLSQKGE